MPRDDAIEVEGVVTEVLPNTVVRVRLPNGHEIQAHRARRFRESGIELAAGDRVQVEMSPFDMALGRITDKETE